MTSAPPPAEIVVDDSDTTETRQLILDGYRALDTLDADGLRAAATHLAAWYPRRWRWLGERMLTYLLCTAEIDEMERHAGILACVDALVRDASVSPLGVWSATHGLPPAVRAFERAILAQRDHRPRAEVEAWERVYDRMGGLPRADALEMFCLHNDLETPHHRHDGALRALFWRPTLTDDRVRLATALLEAHADEASLAHRGGPTPFPGLPPTTLAVALHRYSYSTSVEPALMVACVRAFLQRGADIDARFEVEGHACALTAERFFNGHVTYGPRAGRASAVGELLADAVEAARARRLALAMAFHPRLGRDSPLGALEADLATRWLVPACSLLLHAPSLPPRPRADALRRSLKARGIDMDGEDVDDDTGLAFLRLTQADDDNDDDTDVRFRWWLATKEGDAAYARMHRAATPWLAQLRLLPATRATVRRRFFLGRLRQRFVVDNPH